jgi:hypothetical protein
VRLADASGGVRGATAALAIGAVAGAICALLHTPIPWMLGPLFATAALRVSGLDLGVPVNVRYTGQWVIGTALGLYFTPAVLRQIADVWYLFILGAAFAIVIGYVTAACLSRLARLDLTTSFFASVPGGAAEMTTLGERFGAREDKVAAAQSLRIMLVVAVVPAAFTLAGLRGTDAYTMGTTQFDGQAFAVLMVATLAAGWLAHRTNVPNGFVLFRVLTRKEGNRDALQAQKEELRESLRTREAERLTRSYLTQLRAERKVQVNETLLASFMREGGSRGGNRRS